MQYKLIISDLGNVLISFNHWLAANKLAVHSSKKLGEIYGLLFDSDCSGLFEEGRISQEEFFKMIKKETEVNVTYPAFIQSFNEIFFLTWDNLRTCGLLHSLRSKLEVLVLSNINKAHYEYLKKSFTIFDPFDRVVLSYEQGMRKPDRRLYEHCLKVCNVEARETIYIDDRPDLICEAEKLGLRCHQFTTFDNLTAFFNQLGLSSTEKQDLHLPAAFKK